MKQAQHFRRKLSVLKKAIQVFIDYLFPCKLNRNFTFFQIFLFVLCLINIFFLSTNAFLQVSIFAM